MKFFLLSMLFTCFAVAGSVNLNVCPKEIPGYEVVKNSVYEFKLGQDKACFFAYYRDDPLLDEPLEKVAMWYAYFPLHTPKAIEEFPTPLGKEWGMARQLDAISFVSMYGDAQRDVTVIASYRHKGKRLFTPFVFMRRGNRYIVDMNVYFNLYELPLSYLTVADIQHYIKDHAYLAILEKRK